MNLTQHATNMVKLAAAFTAAQNKMNKKASLQEMLASYGVTLKKQAAEGGAFNGTGTTGSWSPNINALRAGGALGGVVGGILRGKQSPALKEAIQRARKQAPTAKPSPAGAAVGAGVAPYMEQWKKQKAAGDGGASNGTGGTTGSR